MRIHAEAARDGHPNSPDDLVIWLRTPLRVVIKIDSCAIVVGICTRNRASILPKAVASALSQRGCPLRVAVVDDGSTDDTDAVSRQFPTIQWTRWVSNRGYMAARNHLMSLPGADYFVSLDDDAWFLRGDEIAVAIQVLEQRPRVAAVAFDVLSPDRQDAQAREEPRSTAMFFGCGHVVRLAAVRSVGFYEATPGSYGGEEKDLCLRLIDAGYEIVSLPGVHVWHDKTLLARDIPAQHRSGVCNDLVMTLRRSPALLLPVALASKLYRHFVVSWRHELIGPFFEGLALFMRAFPAVWRSRMPVRVATLRTFMRLSRTEIDLPR